MKITIDLRHDEIVDLNKALTLVSDAILERTGQKPAQVQQTSPAQQQAPTIDQLRQNQQSSSNQSSQPTSTGLFAPRQAQQQAAPANRWDVNQTPRNTQAPKQESSTESFGMLNMLGRKR